MVHHIYEQKKIYALKELIKKDDLEIKYIKQEIELHSKVHHKNVIKLVDYFETRDKFYLFLEYAENGDLYEYLRKKISINTKLIFFY